MHTAPRGQPRTCVAPTASTFLLRPGDVTVKSPAGTRRTAREPSEHGLLSISIGERLGAPFLRINNVSSPVLLALHSRLPKLPAAATTSTSGLLYVYQSSCG